MFDLEFFTHEDGQRVVATITWEVFFDSDFFEVGDQVVWKNYHWCEWTTAFTVNGSKYSPTKAEFKEWDKEISNTVEQEAA